SSRVSRYMRLSTPPPLPTSNPSPYTPLFRSIQGIQIPQWTVQPTPQQATTHTRGSAVQYREKCMFVATVEVDIQLQIAAGGRIRSEEHTSELQSRENLVCRLLLEKKKKNHTK